MLDEGNQAVMVEVFVFAFIIFEGMDKFPGWEFLGTDDCIVFMFKGEVGGGEVFGTVFG